MDIYRDIDMKRTGEKIKILIEQKGLCVRDIQNQLYLSCPQPIYRWLKGQILPSVNHLFVLSKILGVHMEELLVEKHRTFEVGLGKSFVYDTKKHIIRYCRKLKCNTI